MHAFIREMMEDVLVVYLLDYIHCRVRHGTKFMIRYRHDVNRMN
jgi:hypothetical protein